MVITFSFIVYTDYKYTTFFFFC